MQFIKNKFVVLGLIVVVLGLGLYFFSVNRNPINNSQKQTFSLDKFFEFKVMRPDLSPELNEKYRNELTVHKDNILKSPDQFNFTAFMSMAMIKYTIGDYDGARDIWLYVSDLRSKNSPSFYNLGNLYADVYKDCDNADKYYQIAMANDPNEISYLRNIFDLYNSKCPDKKFLAEGILNKALGVKPDSQDFLILSAQYWAQNGDRAKAVEFYEKAIKLNPANSALQAEYERFKNQS